MAKQQELLAKRQKEQEEFEKRQKEREEETLRRQKERYCVRVVCLFKKLIFFF